MEEPTPESIISNDEVLYRRVPVSQKWVDIGAKTVDPLAFRPRESDQTGLSFGRAKFATPIEEAARGSIGREFYVVLLSVGRLRAFGISVTAKPLPGYPGHAEIPELTFDNRKTERSREIVQVLRTCVVGFEGPHNGMTVRE